MLTKLTALGHFEGASVPLLGASMPLQGASLLCKLLPLPCKVPLCPCKVPSACPLVITLVPFEMYQGLPSPSQQLHISHVVCPQKKSPERAIGRGSRFYNPRYRSLVQQTYRLNLQMNVFPL